MKKSISVLGYVLFALVVLLPFGTLLTACFGYTFELASITAFAAVTALLSVCLTVLSVKEKEAIDGGVVKVLFALITPLSLVNTVFYLFADSRIWDIACLCVCTVCSVILSVKHGKPLALKITSLVLSALMVLPIAILVFFGLTFGRIGQNTVINSVASPNKAYYAEVIASDQGALGGDTVVNVYENKEINALLFKIAKQPQTVYLGEWGAFETMEIYWEDEHRLVIDSQEYAIE